MIHLVFMMPLLDGFIKKLSDVQSEHVYFRNKVLKNKQNRPILLSECGGYTRPINNHLNSNKNNMAMVKQIAKKN